MVGIEQRLSTAFHPQTDGVTERANQEVLSYLRCYLSFAHYEWASLLPTAQLAINNRNTTGLGISPYYIQHGYHAHPVKLVEPEVKSTTTATKRAQNFLSRISEAQEYAAAAMASAQQLMEEQSNKKRSPAPLFKVGDKVWLHLKNIQSPQLKKKLAWINAKYSITRVISPHVVELDVPTKIHPRFHVELLRKASEDPLPSQLTDDSQPPPILIHNEGTEDSQEQIVEKILRADRFRQGKGWTRRLLVKWKGFAEPTWENRSDLEDVEALDDFEEKYGMNDGVGENEGTRQGRKPKAKTKYSRNSIN